MPNAEIDHLCQVFELLDDWTDRYRHLLELAQKLPPLADEERIDDHKVTGCLSQVWLVADPASGPADEASGAMTFRADSDAQLVRGLIAVLLMLYSGRAPAEIVETDAKAVFAKLGLDHHLSVGRRNGVESMIQRIKSLAEARLAN